MIARNDLHLMVHKNRLSPVCLHRNQSCSVLTTVQSLSSDAGFSNAHFSPLTNSSKSNLNHSDHDHVQKESGYVL